MGKKHFLRRICHVGEIRNFIYFYWPIFIEHFFYWPKNFIGRFLLDNSWRQETFMEILEIWGTWRPETIRKLLVVW